MLGGGYSSKKELPDIISKAPRPLLFAHRGVVDKHFENSQGAIRDALIKGFTAVELDVQFSADSTFFLHHDRNIKLPDNSYITANEIKISENPIMTHLKKESISFLIHIPSLSECTDPFKSKLIFYFDMKRYGHDSVFDLAHDIAEFIKENNLHKTAMVASAHFWFISYLEYTNPEIITVMEGINTEHPWLYNLIPKNFKSDMIASRQATINDNFIQWLKDNDMLSRYIVYHGDETNFQNTLDMGIEMFIVDYAPYLDRYLKPDSSFLHRRRDTK